MIPQRYKASKKPATLVQTCVYLLSCFDFFFGLVIFICCACHWHLWKSDFTFCLSVFNWWHVKIYSLIYVSKVLPSYLSALAKVACHSIPIAKPFFLKLLFVVGLKGWIWILSAEKCATSFRFTCTSQHFVAHFQWPGQFENTSKWGWLSSRKKEKKREGFFIFPSSPVLERLSCPLVWELGSVLVRAVSDLCSTCLIPLCCIPASAGGMESSDVLLKLQLLISFDSCPSHWSLVASNFFAIPIHTFLLLTLCCSLSNPLAIFDRVVICNAAIVH